MMIRRVALAAFATASSNAFRLGGRRAVPGAGGAAAHRSLYVSAGGRTTGSAFTTTSRSHIHPSAIQRGGGGSERSGGGGGGLKMIFGNLFGGGGAFDLKIDYAGLDHPGPELAEWAKEGKVPEASEKDPKLKLATFAGGCFWGLELAYQRVPGVVHTAVGYSQGEEDYPNYDQVCAGATGHTESVIVYYNPKEVAYETLLDAFFDQVNPTTVNGQGRDYGRQYRTGVYFHTKEQEKVAKARFEQEQQNYKKPIASELKQAKPFWPAEKYHQQYLEKGGRFNSPQSAEKGATETIRCYG